MLNGMDHKNGCNFIVIGASGDLSRKKIIPALFSLFVNGFLPKEFNVVGYARTEMDETAFRKMAEDNLKSKYEKEPENLDRIPAFLSPNDAPPYPAKASKTLISLFFIPIRYQLFFLFL